MTRSEVNVGDTVRYEGREYMIENIGYLAGGWVVWLKGKAGLVALQDVANTGCVPTAPGCNAGQGS